MTTTIETPTQNGEAMPTVSHVKAQFQSILAPTTKVVSRKAWGIDVNTIWLPFFTAAKTVGAVNDVDLPDDALGAPYRLRRDKDTGEVRFSQSGRPLFSVAKPLNDMVNRARENYVADLLAKTAAIMDEVPQLFKAQVERQLNAGTPIVETQDHDLAEAVTMALLENAEAIDTPAPTPRKSRKAS